VTRKPAIFAFDTETTGLVAGFNEIISLAGILYDNQFQEIDRVLLHAYPDKPENFHAKAKEINGYTTEEWEARGATTQQQMAEELNEWLIRRYCYRVIPLGHNVKFDLAHLQALYETHDMFDAWDKLFSYHCIDTVGISMFFDMSKHGEVARKYNLVSLCERFDIDLTNAHDALADISATVELFKKLAELVSGDKLAIGKTAPSARRRSNLIVQQGDEWVFARGKHKDQTLDKVASGAPDYLAWMLDKVTELSDEQKEAIDQALDNA